LELSSSEKHIYGAPSRSESTLTFWQYANVVDVLRQPVEYDTHTHTHTQTNSAKNNGPSGLQSGQLECGPMSNVMAAQPNVSGALR